MPSPDVAEFVGLDLIEADEQTLIDSALAMVAARFPDWTPREGNTELVLLEAIAMLAAEEVYAINRLPEGLTEVLLRLFGVERDQGAPPSADVRFTVYDATGYTIPAGTNVRLNLGEGEPVDLATDADLVIPAGAIMGTVVAYGIDATTEANGQPAGTPLELLDGLTYVTAVELASTSSGGRPPEDGLTYLTRAVPLLSRLTTTLVRPVDVEAYVAENPAVTRVRALDLYNPALPANPPGSAPGYVTVAVAGTDGAGVDSATKASLKAELRSRMHAGLTVDVVDATVTVVDVELTVLRFAGADTETTRANVVAAVEAYLDPNTWAWSDTVRVNELIAAADRAGGVDTVLTVTTPAADQLLPGYAPLATAGAITVNVQAP